MLLSYMRGLGSGSNRNGEKSNAKLDEDSWYLTLETIERVILPEVGTTLVGLGETKATADAPQGKKV